MGPGEVEMFTPDYWMLMLVGLTGLGVVATPIVGLASGWRAAGVTAMITGISGITAWLLIPVAAEQEATLPVYAQVDAVVAGDPALKPALRSFMKDRVLTVFEARALGDLHRANVEKARREKIAATTSTARTKMIDRYAGDAK